MSDIFDDQSPVYARPDGAIGRIVLNRPSKKNAMSYEMWCRVAESVAVLDGTSEVKVIVLCSSTEGSFSAGADLAELEVIAKDPERREANRKAIRDAQRALARAAKPTIAEISGPCVGGGCGLAIHCDFRFAAEGSRFGITPAKIGLVYPLNDTKELMDLVGVGKAKSMLFTGRLVDATEALAMGLIDRRVAANELATEVEDYANHMASLSQYSLYGIKKTMQRILDGQVDDDPASEGLFLDAHEGEDAQEGVSAFIAKRKPRFTWSYSPDD